MWFPGAALMGVTDRDAGAGARLRGPCPRRPRFPDLESMVAAGIDVVHVLTPPPGDAQVALEALEPDRHALVEKPLATSEADCMHLAHVASLAVVASVRIIRCSPIRRCATCSTPSPPVASGSPSAPSTSACGLSVVAGLPLPNITANVAPVPRPWSAWARPAACSARRDRGRGARLRVTRRRPEPVLRRVARGGAPPAWGRTLRLSWSVWPLQTVSTRTRPEARCVPTWNRCSRPSGAPAAAPRLNRAPGPSVRARRTALGTRERLALGVGRLRPYAGLRHAVDGSTSRWPTARRCPHRSRTAVAWCAGSRRQPGSPTRPSGCASRLDVLVPAPTRW